MGQDMPLRISLLIHFFFLFLLLLYKAAAAAAAGAAAPVGVLQISFAARHALQP